jgi:hypothetical protein
MKTASDYRIERVREMNFNGKNVIAFDAYVKTGEAFVFFGAYTAPKRTAKKNLWTIPNQQDAGRVE